MTNSSVFLLDITIVGVDLFPQGFAAVYEKLKDMTGNMNVHLLDSAFDMNYNLGLYNTLVAVAHDGKTADKIKLYIPSNLPDGTYTMNFLDNHDMNSYERTIMAGIRFGMKVAHVGKAFLAHSEEKPEDELYFADLHHSSPWEAPLQPAQFWM